MIPPLLAILSWPLLTWRLFTKLDSAAALCWCIIGGFLLLPARVSLNLPVLPSIDKHTMPAFVAAVFLYLISRKQRYNLKATTRDQVLKSKFPRNPITLVLFVTVFVGLVMTVLTNSDPLVFGSAWIPGLSIYDALSLSLALFLFYLPLLLARRYLASPEQHKTLLRIYCISMLIYSVPALWEIRMSPQLNNFFYGYANGWKQHIRYGGFRPLVFLQHSLWLGMFAAGATLAALAMWRIAEPAHRKRYLLLGLYLFVVLVLCKTITALIIVLVIAPFILFVGSRIQLTIAALISAVVLFYPMLRGAGAIPIDAIMEQAEKIDAERAGSLAFRLRNEDVLLDKANQRPYFGWGSWGRNRVYNEAGEDISVTDGTWVIVIGSNGWVGYISQFGLLAIPIIVLAMRRKRYDVGPETSLLCLILAGNLVDLIPNSGLMPSTMLMAGALIGRMEYKAEPVASSSATTIALELTTSRYTRSGLGRDHLSVAEPDGEVKPASVYARQFNSPKLRQDKNS